MRILTSKQTARFQTPLSEPRNAHTVTWLIPATTVDRQAIKAVRRDFRDRINQKAYDSARRNEALLEAMTARMSARSQARAFRTMLAMMAGGAILMAVATLAAKFFIR